jgi:hypothetical protein
MGNWKAIRTGLRREDADTSIQLYDLNADIGEAENQASSHPGLVAEFQKIMLSARSESEHFPFPEIRERRF